MIANLEYGLIPGFDSKRLNLKVAKIPPTRRSVLEKVPAKRFPERNRPLELTLLEVCMHIAFCSAISSANAVSFHNICKYTRTVEV